MKILFLSQLYLPHIGGVEKHVCEISSILKSKGNEITILTSKFDKKLKYYDDFNGIKVVRFDYPKTKFVGLFFVWFFIFKNRYLIEQNDIVHIHDVFIWYFPFRFLYRKKKVFTTFHGYESFPVKFRSKVIRRISEVLSNGSICIGDYLKKWYGHNPNFVSYGAVDLNEFTPVRVQKKYDGIFVGRLDLDTGIKNYISMIRILRKREIDFRMLVLGDGIYKNKAEKYSMTLGFVSNPQSYFKYSKFSFVSGYLSILESFACKKLVFSTYDNDLKRDSLFLSPFIDWIVVESDPKKIAEKVEYFSKNEDEARKRIDQAYKWVKNNSWLKLVDSYMELWSI